MAATADFSQKIKGSKKILFAGLDNSGKTSIISCLKQGLASLGLVNPTYLVERSKMQYLGYDIIQHDMGGQQKYIQSYLKEPGQYFDQADACIYVVDIQDRDRVYNTTAYFKAILASFTKLAIKPPIYVMLHKAERYLDENNGVDGRTMEFVKTRMLEENDGKFPLDFTMTTIKSPWTITSAFAAIFNSIVGRVGRYKQIINELATATGAEFAAVFDQHGIPVAQNAQGKVQDDIVKQATPAFLKDKEMLDQIKGKQTDRIIVEWDGHEFILLAVPIAFHLTLLLVATIGRIDKARVLDIALPIIQRIFG
jgi:GTPase SAR1 family protein/predicted regulator of Ras-like GTPase activity (Roadblock/LC7/MglB family)